MVMPDVSIRKYSHSLQYIYFSSMSQKESEISNLRQKGNLALYGHAIYNWCWMWSLWVNMIGGHIWLSSVTFCVQQNRLPVILWEIFRFKDNFSLYGHEGGVLDCWKDYFLKPYTWISYGVIKNVTTYF